MPQKHHYSSSAGQSKKNPLHQRNSPPERVQGAGEIQSGGRGDSNTPAPDSKLVTLLELQEAEFQAAHYPAHVQPFLVDPRLTLVKDAWDELPEAIKAGITAMVQAAGD
jgi:hypothetical protein